MQEIKVLWEGPFHIEDILNDKIDKNKYDVKAGDIGLYSIYASHPLYGDSVLVYIGRTTAKKGFKFRLKDRWVIENGSDPENVQIYLGTIFSDSKRLEKEEILNKKLIEKVEVLLINALSPAYNSSNIQSANKEFIDDRYIIHNCENYRKLPTTLDSKYFWQDYKNFQIVSELAEMYDVKKLNDDERCYGFEINEIHDFNVGSNYTMWFGVFYEEWNESKIPLELEIYGDKNIMNKIKLLKLDGFKYKKYDDDEEDYFQLELDADFLNLDKNELKKSFSDKINKIIKQIGN